ncbi:MAG: PDZ domain-containing protein [Candidatus Cloacimonetes bacterium]|nr:PDZ domain-containing protein [Candidatus Cloacimonadota bacterium]
MKKISLILILTLALSSLLLADADLKQDIKDLEDVNRLIMELKGLDDVNTRVVINRTGGKEASDAAYFGLYLEDLTFPKAQTLNYKGNIGVLVTGVVRDSPAWNYRIQEDDIILSVHNKEVTNYAAFERIRKALRAGDVATIVVFRDGKTESFDMTIGSRGSSSGSTPVPQTPTKKKLSPGYGGGTWVPLWMELDMTDINDLITDPALGFGAFPMSIYCNKAWAAKLPVGKGYFLGGQITWYEDSKRKNVADSNYHVWLQYSSTMGGVTLDKRIPITKNVTASMGLMVGGANHELEFVNTDANYDWDSLPNIITGSNNTHFKLSKGYLIAQPRAELLVRFLPWLGIRAEGGYAYGINLRENWRVIGMGEEEYEVSGSPNTKYEGITFTVGPWFGF